VQVTQLAIYPVKGAAGRAVDAARVEPWGLTGDRRWAIVDDDGAKITSQRHVEVLHVSATPAPSNGASAGGNGVSASASAGTENGEGIVLAAPGRSPLTVPVPGPGADTVAVRISRLPTATCGGPAAAAWLSDVLGRPARLVWLDDPRRRPIDLAHGGRPGEPLSLADAGPLLLVTEASLRRLDAWVAEEAERRGEPVPSPLAPARFRPNVVIDGDVPFAEDGWARVRVGDVAFRLGEACDRCIVTTIDPTTLARGREPMRTLRLHRRRANDVYFGLRLVPEETGVLTVGDPVTVLPPA
jgi:uncharacterized protein YcbX